jgi:HEAT repeat protein/cyclophilin family peptidyl-prolyl cis-trans isomerase
MSRPVRLRRLTPIFLLALSALAGCATSNPAPSTATPAPGRPPLSDVDITDIALLVKLEDTRQFDAAILGRLLKSPHPEVKRRAIVSVGRIVNPAGTALLEPLRTDSSADIVATVAFAHGQLKDPAAVAWLATTLQSATTPAPVAFEAARALGKIRGPEAWAALSGYLTSVQESPATRPVVSEALLSIGRFTDPPNTAPARRADITSIVRWTSSVDAGVRWHAAWALFRPRNPAAVPHLFRLSQDPDPEVRFWSVRGLTPALVDEARAPGVDRAAASARLRAAVKDSDRRVRTEALRVLAAYDDNESFAVVLAALDDPDTWVSVTAAETLGRFKDRIAEVTPKLAAAAAPGKPAALRVTALTPLTQLAPPLALDAGEKMLRDPSLFVRTAATQTMRRMGALGQQLLDRLTADPAMKDLLIPIPQPAAARIGGAPPAPAAPIPGRTDAEYRAIVTRWIVPAYSGSRAPRAIWTTPKGEIEVELHPGDAPLGMEELVRLTESRAIVGTLFTRLVPNFVAQQATITGANRLRDEVSRRGLLRGTLAWASSGLDSGRAGYTLGSTPQPHNEGDFTSLGHVVRGMDVVDRLELGDAITAARLVRSR